MNCYARYITEDLAALGLPVGQYDPADVEAWMRLEHSTLNGLDPVQFRAEVAEAVACIDVATPEETASLRQSFGL